MVKQKQVKLDAVNQWINLCKQVQNYAKPTSKYFNKIVPKIICNDGFTISIQASECHYCSPREQILNLEKDDSKVVHTAFELGFPSKKESLILKDAEEPRKPKQTVYGWVNLDLIQQVIKKHGGLNYAKMLNQLNKYLKEDKE